MGLAGYILELLENVVRPRMGLLGMSPSAVSFSIVFLDGCSHKMIVLNVNWSAP